MHRVTSRLTCRTASRPEAVGDGADIWSVEPEELGRYAEASHAEDDDFGQAGTLYREVMDGAQRAELVENIVRHASAEVSAEVQDRVVEYWTQVDSVLGARVGAGLKAPPRGDAGAGRGPSRRLAKSGQVPRSSRVGRLSKELQMCSRVRASSIAVRSRL